MPLGDDFYGTNDDDSINMKYCKFCFINGAFTNPNQTLDEMIQTSVENMIKEVGINREDALKLANTFIPNLRRWKAN